MPAKNAPSANDTPNNCADPKAILTAAATTHNVNSSREPVRATCQSSHGKTRRPATSMSATKMLTAASVLNRVNQMSAAPIAASPALSTSANAGSKTSTSTIARSSTTSQPTAIRPLTVVSSAHPSSAFNNTTVLATDNARPNTIAPPGDQPHDRAVAAPSPVATVICTMAPGSAILRTDIK